MQKLRTVLMGVLTLGFVYMILVFSLIVSASFDRAPQNVPVMIVLGARVMGEAPAQPSKLLKERLDTAVSYLRDNPETKVVVTGGQGANESEPEGVVMGRYLIEHGIEESRVYIEDTSTSTIENIENALAIIDTDQAVIVTNGYHVYRAKRTASKIGIETVYGLGAPTTWTAVYKSYWREIIALGYHLIFTH